MDLKGDLKNLMSTNHIVKDGHHYTIPSPGTYPYQWLWDSCFHAIIFIRLNMISIAKEELLAAVYKQFSNGLLPHIIYWQKLPFSTFHDITWGKPDTSSITQPPIIAYAVKRIFDKDKDINFVNQIYPYLSKYYMYLLKKRDARSHHLVSIINPDESGEDNSPRFDISLGLPSRHDQKENFRRRLSLIDKNLKCNFDEITCMRNIFWVKDVPFNALLTENLKILAELAQLIHDEKENFWKDEAALVESAMRKYMFEDGVFWSVYGDNYTKIKAKTWAIFAPLFAGLYSQQEADEVINKYLLNKNEFSTQYMVPSTSKSDAAYEPNGFWRGPVWMATNWFIYKGLLRYSKKEEARKICKASIDLLKKSGFREQFNPETGEGYGANDFTWSGLVLDMDICDPDSQNAR